MKRILKSTLLAGAALAVLAIARPASAQSTILVTANVPQTCQITSTGNIDFGSYDPIGANETVDDTAAGSVTYRCTRGTVPLISIDDGAAPAGRQMAGPGGATLNYELYQPNATRWGTAGAEIYTDVARPSAAPATVVVSAVIPAGQDVAAGAYTDTVNVTILP